MRLAALMSLWDENSLVFLKVTNLLVFFSCLHMKLNESIASNYCLIFSFSVHLFLYLSFDLLLRYTSSILFFSLCYLSSIPPSFCLFSTRLFSSLGELHTISQRSYGTTYTIRPGSRYPVTRRTPSPGSPDRGDPLGRLPAFGLPTSPTAPPHTILKSSSLSLPHEPKEVRFVMRSSSARSRSPSPSPSHSPGLGSPLLALRPFHQKPLHLWNKYDVGDWLESINLGEHRAGFQEHEIEGSHLPALTKDDFAELGVTRVGHRMNIERALKQLLESWPPPWNIEREREKEGEKEKGRWKDGEIRSWSKIGRGGVHSSFLWLFFRCLCITSVFLWSLSKRYVLILH